MGPTVHLEYERKYDVADEAVLPSLPAEDQRRTERLVAVYFDTPDLVLARRHIVIRRREGGADEGWHIKAQQRDGDRIERHWPLTDGDEVPEALLALVRVHVRGSALVPIARILTTRTVVDVHDKAGRKIAEICDDRVTATDMRSHTVRAWHEWELELAGVAPRSAKEREARLDALEKPLAKAGAKPAASVSKLARALGVDAAPVDSAPARPALTRNDTARDVLSRIIDSLVEELHAADPEARSGDAEAVHHMRSYVRRIRSVLSSYRRVYDDELVTRVLGELAALGRALGGARDPLVLHERARNLVRSQPDKPMHAQVLSRLVSEKEAEARVAHGELVSWLNSPRYFALLDELDALIRSDGVSEYAGRPARAELRRGLRHDVARVRKAMKRGAKAPVGAGHDELLHAIRKASRRLRFAAEAVTTEPADIFGAKVARVAVAAKRVQDTLGEHRDSVLLQHALVASSNAAHAAGVDSFGYGRLHALEQLRGDTELASYSRAAERLHRRGKRL